MCCKSNRHHGDKHQNHHHGHGRHGDSCCCGKHSGFGPCFWTREEKIARIEEYLASLQEKVKAVEERITALREE